MGATGVCIGALTRQDCRSIRLCVADGVHHHPVSAPYRIGQVWDLAYEPAKLIEPPHVEDVVLAGPGRFVAMQSGMGRYLAACVSVWEGGPVALFGGRLRFTASGSGYLDREAGVTPSVGFWRPDRDLDLEPGESQRYRYAGGPTPASIKYVGTDEAASRIPAGALVRVSLSRPFAPASGPNECWLQLSGWYREGA